ncbi:MAG: hypothetical protein NT030_07065 [Candidatus Saganbacteria bacterium]|nr:hypothetical protein [Candidatus Saganbacteria bacterium]
MKKADKTSGLVSCLETVLWDSGLDAEEALDLLSHPASSRRGITAENLYVKILGSCSWYTVLELFPAERLKEEILTEEVVNRLFPPVLRQRYRYARSLL